MVGSAALPPELISLVHHVELNKAGWWEKSVQQLVVAAIWRSGETLTLQDVTDRLREYFSVNLDVEKVRSHIDALCASDILVPLDSDHFRITERSLKEFQGELEEIERVEEEARRRFVDTTGDCCPSIDGEATWRSFNDDFLVPLVREMGARTYELISGAGVDEAAAPRLQRFLEGYEPEIRAALRSAVITFLDPRDPNVRSYVLRRLNAYFLLEAGNLSAETVEALTRVAGKAPSFTVFVDTNFLFSALGLHENPSNEAVQLLVDLVRRLSGKVRLKLCVLPITVDEARGVLDGKRLYLRSLRLTPNLAAIAATSGLSGFAQKFAEESKKAGRPLRSDDYFGPYINNLIRIARAKGVEFFNRKVDQYRGNADVLADVEERLRFEQWRYGSSAKGRKELEHDIVLWHFVRDQRPARVESPLEAEHWIVTVDLRFLGFDTYKRLYSPNRIPICLHPATLIQMLQLWVPRTQEFEEAVLGSLRLPCLFQEFDPAAERLTVSILGALARFESIGDLPQEAVGSILMNDALRQRIQAERDVGRQVEVVREALIEEIERISSELASAQARAQRLEGRAGENAETAADLERQVQEWKNATEELERQLVEERVSATSLQERVDKLESDSRAKDQRERAKAQVRVFTARWVLAPLAVIVALGLAISLPLASFTDWSPLRSALAAVGVCSASLAVWVWVADLGGSRDPVVAEWRAFRLFHGFKKWLFGALGTIVAAVLANALWDWLKQS